MTLVVENVPKAKKTKKTGTAKKTTKEGVKEKRTTEDSRKKATKKTTTKQVIRVKDVKELVDYCKQQFGRKPFQGAAIDFHPKKPAFIFTQTTTQLRKWMPKNS